MRIGERDLDRCGGTSGRGRRDRPGRDDGGRLGRDDLVLRPVTRADRRL
jgi:hypothetical protein